MQMWVIFGLILFGPKNFVNEKTFAEKLLAVKDGGGMKNISR